MTPFSVCRESGIGFDGGGKLFCLKVDGRFKAGAVLLGVAALVHFLAMLHRF
jgi:hypothetical protein